jgi:hypothetical protein
MPKELIDYSNTIIYKIYCKDSSIKDVYVGHTTNFTKRKYHHKVCSNIITNKSKIYKTIRDNGGWDNWDMIEIAKYNCKDVTEARIKEYEHYTLLNSSLNTASPYLDKSKIFCDICNIQCYKQDDFLRHIKSNKHNKNINGEQNKIKSNKKFHCDKCNFECCYESDWKRHLRCIKHLKKVSEQTQTESNKCKVYHCLCGKKYKDNSGLWKHQQKCKNKNEVKNDNDDNELENDNSLMLLLKETIKATSLLQEQNKMMMDMIIYLTKDNDHNINQTDLEL